MKMVKKVLLGLIATATVIGFVGCKPMVEDENDMLKVKGDTCTIDFENTTADSYSRGFETLKQDHVDGICKITATVNNNTGSGDGVFGYIFNETKNDDGTYNFTLAGLRFKASKIEYYVSDYKNVSGAYLSSGNDFCDINGVVAGKPGSLATVNESNDTENGIDTLKTLTIKNEDEISIWIDVVANDGSSIGRKDTKNTYTVKFYDKDPGRTKDGDDLTYNTSVSAIKTAKNISLNNPLPNNTEHFSATKGQSKLGFYANVYGGRKLTGKWEIDSNSLYHEAEEIVE